MSTAIFTERTLKLSPICPIPGRIIHIFRPTPWGFVRLSCTPSNQPSSISSSTAAQTILISGKACLRIEIPPPRATRKVTKTIWSSWTPWSSRIRIDMKAAAPVPICRSEDSRISQQHQKPKLTWTSRRNTQVFPAVWRYRIYWGSITWRHIGSPVAASDWINKEPIGASRMTLRNPRSRQPPLE